MVGEVNTGLSPVSGKHQHIINLLWSRLRFSDVTRNFTLRGAEAHRERGARGYNGVRGRAPGQGVRGQSPPEADSFFVDVRP